MHKVTQNVAFRVSSCVRADRARIPLAREAPYPPPTGPTTSRA